MADCRLVLILNEDDAPADPAATLKAALSGGDVAAVIIAGREDNSDLKIFQDFCAPLVTLAQEHGAAAVIAGDSRVAGRLKADGIHLDADPEAVADAVATAAGRTIVGASAGTTRHLALEIGEARPDYVFFGRFRGDSHPEAHPANLERGAWWAAFVEVPCIVMGGTDVASVTAIAETGAEFAALARAVIHSDDPAAAVREACGALAAAEVKPLDADTEAGADA